MLNPEWTPQLSERTLRRPVDGILGAIGGTPLVRLRRYAPDASVQLWAKLESANPGGSAKDRPALAMLRSALDSGRLLPGGTVIESSSGNMGIGLAQACRFHGLTFICVVDARAQPVNVQIMRAFGADVRVVSPDSAITDPLAARLALVAHLVRTIPGAYWPNQYANPANSNAHANGTIREIDDALDGRLDLLLVATSTSGTLVGCRDYLRREGRTTRIVAVDAVGSVLFGGLRTPRRMPGIGAGVVTELSREATFDELIRVDDLDCVIGCRRLLEREAILAGGSSGGVMVAFDQLLPRLRPGTRCAAILPDGGSSYLDTVYDDSWVERELRCEPGRLQELCADLQPAAASRT